MGAWPGPKGPKGSPGAPGGDATVTESAVRSALDEAAGALNVGTSSAGVGEVHVQFSDADGAGIDAVYDSSEPVFTVALNGMPTKIEGGFFLVLDANNYVTLGVAGSPYVGVGVGLGEGSVGFFAKATAPVPRQSITGATTADALESVIDALVAFGLVTDNR